MDIDLMQVIDGWNGLRALVIGDCMLDTYYEGHTGRLCPEAPVPVVDVRARYDLPGGAANTAANLAALGAHVMMLSAVGHDLEGVQLRQLLEERKVCTAHLLSSPRKTLAKHRVMATEQLLVRFDYGATDALDERTEQAILDRLMVDYPECDVIVVSDYGYGILTPRVLACLGELQQRWPRVLAVDSKRLPLWRSLEPTAVKPNFNEAVQLLGGAALDPQVPRAGWVTGHAEKILELTGARVAAVTLDVDGAVVLERSASPYRTYASPQANCRAAGAGDTYLGALALALAAKAETAAAAELAAAASAVVVKKGITATCSADELRDALFANAKQITSFERVKSRVEQHRAQGRRIVLTNGCFDILHSGHVTYLNRAKALGDVLIVGVNSDESVRRLKGPTRPINPLEDRMQVLAALSCVDHVVPFEDSTPIRLIEAARPDVFVKGGDYTRETLPEADNVEAFGGVVQILPFVEQRSTTGIIARIRDYTTRNPSFPIAKEGDVARNLEPRHSSPLR